MQEKQTNKQTKEASCRLKWGLQRKVKRLMFARRVCHLHPWRILVFSLTGVRAPIFCHNYLLNQLQVRQVTDSFVWKSAFPTRHSLINVTLRCTQFLFFLHSVCVWGVRQLLVLCSPCVVTREEAKNKHIRQADSRLVGSKTKKRSQFETDFQGFVLLSDSSISTEFCKVMCIFSVSFESGLTFSVPSGVFMNDFILRRWRMNCSK